MAKAKSVFVCAECGASALKWMGMCPSCGEAGTLSEQAAERGARAAGPAASPVLLAEIEAREVERVAPDLNCGAARALRQQYSETPPLCDVIEQRENRLSVPEFRCLGEITALAALHRERDRATRGDRVDPEFVTAAGRRQHQVRIRDAAQRPEREQALVFDARLAVSTESIDVAAADRAARARRPLCAGSVGRLAVEMFDGQFFRVVELARLEIPGGERGDPIERSEVGCRSELAVFRRGGSEGALRQIPRE